MPLKPLVYLWLCCEGWLRFGPYEWLSKDEEKNAYIGPLGQVLAFWDEEESCWRASEEKYKSWVFCNPMITASRRHPAPMYGGIPVKSDE